jgi:SanA protein
MNEPFNRRTLRHLATLGAIAIFLWGLAAYGWYVVYLWVMPIPVASVILTLAVIPIPFVAYRWMAHSQRLASLSESRMARRARPLLDFTRRAIVVLFVIGTFVLVAPRLVTGIYTWPFAADPANVPPHRTAVVFGAGLLWDGRLSPLLRERVETAADLYLAGKVEKILMSGDNRFVNYNEPAAMQEYALRLGVPDNAIVLDYAGRRTYDTCYRALAIFGVEDAILVTQDYHLSRAIYTCRTLGINATGVAAKRTTTYLRLPPILDNGRESLATWGAFWELYISHPTPVLGKPEPIFPSLGE